MISLWYFHGHSIHSKPPMFFTEIEFTTAPFSLFICFSKTDSKMKEGKFLLISSPRLTVSKPAPPPAMQETLTGSVLWGTARRPVCPSHSIHSQGHPQEPEPPGPSAERGSRDHGEDPHAEATTERWGAGSSSIQGAGSWSRGGVATEEIFLLYCVCFLCLLCNLAANFGHVSLAEEILNPNGTSW